LTYNVSDAAGNVATPVTRTVIVSAATEPVDTTKPVITRVGDATVNLTVGDSYTDAGATATDETDGDITGSIVTTGSVDTNTPGTYTLTYNVSDAAGNVATPVTRTVIVSAATEPASGPTDVSVKIGWNLVGATTTGDVTDADNIIITMVTYSNDSKSYVNIPLTAGKRTVIEGNGYFVNCSQIGTLKI
jgi:hypothetical protein